MRDLPGSNKLVYLKGHCAAGGLSHPPRRLSLLLDSNFSLPLFFLCVVSGSFPTKHIGVSGVLRAALSRLGSTVGSKRRPVSPEAPGQEADAGPRGSRPRFLVPRAPRGGTPLAWPPSHPPSGRPRGHQARGETRRRGASRCVLKL